MKRLGLFILLIIFAALGIELTLSAMRQREITLNVRVSGNLPTAPESTPAPKATPAPGASASASLTGETLFMSTDSTLTVDVAWNFRIGPTFPKTAIVAQVQDASGAIVAAAGYTIECGRGNSLECASTHSLELFFNVRDSGGERAPFPPGTYILEVTRAFANARVPEVVLRREVRVLG